MLAETSADFVDVEHPISVPATTTASDNRHSLKVLIVLL
jgi:hypothetical protein